MWLPQHLTSSQKEERRLAAASLVQSGVQSGRQSQAQIARELGVSRQIVSRWVKQLQSGGTQALLHRRPSGRPACLTSSQWQAVLSILREGAQASGFATERWTLLRIAQMIKKRFGVSYHPHYLSERLHALGWSVQTPEVVARERDEQLVQAWLRGDWPRILKKRNASERRSPLSMR
jgi:transposase